MRQMRRFLSGRHPFTALRAGFVGLVQNKAAEATALHEGLTASAQNP
jgi:hypothetical protein